MLKFKAASSVHIILLLLLYNKLSLFSYTFFGYSWYIDLTSRLSLNESLINLYHFFWTSLTYLPSFYFLVFIILTSYLIFWQYLTSIFFISLLYILYNTELINYIILNSHYSICDNNISSINILLTNNLNKYHPFIFYISSILFFLLTIEFLVYVSQNLKFSRNWTILNVNYLKYLIFIINIFTLYLGSWWALQEGTWGGWWNWDPSEVFGLMFSLGLLTIIHSTITPINFYLIRLKILNLSIVIVASYFFIQLNFDLVSHNFGSKFFFFFNNNLFFLESIFFLLILTTYLNLEFLNLKYSLVTLSTNLPKLVQLKTNKYSLLTWLSYSILLGVILLVLISFMALTNYFFWNFLGLNIFNTEFDNKKIIVLFLILLAYPLSHFSYLYLLPLLSFLALINPSDLSILIFLRFKRSLVFTIHIILISFLVQNIGTYSTNFVLWFDTCLYKEYYFNRHLNHQAHSSYTCNTFYIDLVDIYQDHSFNYLISWNTLYASNTPVTSSFYLNFSNDNFFNLYKLNENWQNIYLYIETIHINNLNYLLLLLLIIVLSYIF